MGGRRMRRKEVVWMSGKQLLSLHCIFERVDWFSTMTLGLIKEPSLESFSLP